MKNAAASLVVLGALTAGAPALARTITAIDAPAGDSVERTALALIRAEQARFGGDGAQLHVRRVIPLNDGAVVRIAQRQGALPVLDAEVAVLALDGRIIAASGRLQAVHEVAPGTRLDRAGVTAALRQRSPNAELRSFREGIWAAPTGPARPVWVVDLATREPFGLWRVRVDALTGQVLWGHSTMREARAYAYEGNPVTSALAPVRLLGLREGRHLVGEHADVYACMYSRTGMSCDRNATRDSLGAFPYRPDEPSLSDPFAEVHAYYHVDRIHRWFEHRFGFVRPAQRPMDVAVNFSYLTQSGARGMYNAFYGDLDGDGNADLVFGQGSRDFAYDADVIYHEFGHSVVGDTAVLDPTLDAAGLNAMPIALNEGFADLFASMLTGDSRVGEYAGDGGIRNLEGDAQCADTLTGESHADGLIWGRAVWAVWSQLSAEQRRTMENVLYSTLTALESSASIGDAAAMLVRVAQTAAPTLAPMIDATLRSRGLIGCSRIVPLTSGTARWGYLYGLGSYMGGVTPGPLQYRIDVPADATAMTLEVVTETNPWYTVEVGFYVRRDQPVEWALTKPASYDHALGSGQSSVTFSAGAPSLNLAPGSTYYVLPVNNSESATVFELSATVDAPGAVTAPPTGTGTVERPGPSSAAAPGAFGAPPASPETTVDPVSAQSPQAGGCGLAATGEAPSLPGVLLTLLLAAILLTRPRRRSPD